MFKLKIIKICIFVLLVQDSFSHSLPQIFKEFGKARIYMKGDSLFVSTGEVERKWVWIGKGLVTRYVKNLTTGQIYSNTQKLIKCDRNLQNTGIEKEK